MAKIRYLSIVMWFGLFCSEPAQADRDTFAGVTCASDIVKTIPGRKLSDGPVVALEQAHADIGLKDLGGDGEDEPYFLTWWEICKKRYLFISEAKHQVIKQIVAYDPPADGEFEILPGSCSLGESNLFLGIAKRSTSLDHEVVRGWIIDEKNIKLVPVQTGTVHCAKEFNQ